MLRGKDATLAAILKVIMEDKPETQDEIANILGVSRRYVAKLLKPLIDEGVVRHPYVVDLEKLSKLNIKFDTDIILKEILNTFERMGNNVLLNLDKAFMALKNNDIETAKNIIIQDYTLNRMEEEVNIMIKMDALRYLPTTYAMNLSSIASNIERCGDYISNISEEVVNGLKIKNKELQREIDEIYLIIREMFVEAMDILKTKKRDSKIFELEDKLHEKLEKIMEKVSKEKGENINYYIQFGMFLKDVERFGDRCVNIVEIARELYHGIPRSVLPEGLKKNL
ncbi:phosphate signaling complex PhoU family protein [Methanotorris igneus]|uniref:Phosphate uptake regulator, PhoU n=1 Tax=Methanotorris igneus (strain DSM 5666 / JCM 11834 / Kol 5) TaxID=880724 RepID=F6BE46_METIK|nr:PhoU domain-containing protein [Methanotorris igneus]AEF95582.1 phosphate uptake regulator, PhoU [Methanotorris igneus Kol 5]